MSAREIVDTAAGRLVMAAIQSDRYAQDADFRDAVDDALAEARHLAGLVTDEPGNLTPDEVGDIQGRSGPSPQVYKLAADWRQMRVKVRHLQERAAGLERGWLAMDRELSRLRARAERLELALGAAEAREARAKRALRTIKKMAREVQVVAKAVPPADTIWNAAYLLREYGSGAALQMAQDLERRSEAIFAARRELLIEERKENESCSTS
jgi:hypothetical protein